MTAEDVEMSLDDDIIPLDEEEQKALAEAAAAGIASSATAPTAATEETAGIPEAYLMDLDDYGKITPEKIHVRGVDEMSTEQVTAWANGHTPGMELRRVEWIDDTSCNLQYDSRETAGQALDLLSAGEVSPEQKEDRTIIRGAKPAESHPASKLQVRIAKDTDRKQRGARERSRYYLFNPDQDRVEMAERRRREAKERRQGGRRRDGDYDRRPYDEREDRRRRDRDEEPDQFDASMYDDDAGARDTRDRRDPEQRRYRRSYDRSRSPRRDRDRDSGRDSYRPRSDRSISPWREKKEAVELFPHKVKSNVKYGLLATVEPDYSGIEEPTPTPVMDPTTLEAKRTEKTFAARSARDLARNLGLAGTQRSKSSQGSASGKSLEDRISMPTKSLEERISMPSGKELFPNKVASSERGHSGKLNINVDENFRRESGRRRNRKKAEDMFGGK